MIKSIFLWEKITIGITLMSQDQCILIDKLIQINQKNIKQVSLEEGKLKNR